MDKPTSHPTNDCKRMIPAIVALAILAAACIYLGVRLDRATKERNAAQQRDLLKLDTITMVKQAIATRTAA